MSCPMKRSKLAMTAALLMAGASQVFAAEEDKWEFGVNVYAWIAGIGGTTSGGGNIDVPFSDIVSNLDFALMLSGEAHKGKWSVLSDILYMDISDKINASGNVFDPPAVDGKVKVTIEAWVVNLAGGYTVVDMDKLHLDVVAGARYLYMEPGLSLSINNQPSRSFSDSGDVLDGIVGIRGKTDLTDKWFLAYYLDVGTGDTDSTWQAQGGFGYHFSSLDAFAGYRYLKWNFDSNNTGGRLFDDLDMSGPYAGVRFRF